MDKRKEQIEDIKRKIREKRAEMDPAVLERAQRAAEKSQGFKPLPTQVPYDKKAAHRVIELFLKGNPGMQDRLRAILQKDKGLT
jgi:hypothetical protein